MSNCIEICGGGRLSLSYSEFDIAGFRALCERAEKIINRENCVSHEDGHDDERAIWWYMALGQGAHFQGKADDECVLEFGQSRSSHTNRDFRWLLSVLDKFFKRPVKHHFRVADEYDGFQQVDPWFYEFGAEKTDEGS